MFRALFYAVLLAMAVWGGLKLYRGEPIPFVGSTLEDAGALASVKAALALHRDLSTLPISVRARGRVVTLTGEVATDAEKAEAEQLIEGLKGVDAVENLIAVTPGLDAGNGREARSLGERLDDAALTAKVQGAFALHRDLSQCSLTVEAREGAVTLRGRVADLRLASLAERWALRVRGVESVENRIEVGPPVESGDTSMARVRSRIEAAFRDSESLRSYGLRSLARGKVIVLSGSVSSLAERELAEVLARRVAGDRPLDNQIRLQE